MFYYYRAPSPGGLKSCKYFASLFIFRPQAGLNTASNGFIKASKKYAAPMKVTFRGLSHTASRRPQHGCQCEVWFQKEVRGVPSRSRGGEGGVQRGSRQVSRGSRDPKAFPVQRRKTQKHSQKIWGPCAKPLRSCNQHSVQQVPVGQNGSRYPLGGRSAVGGEGPTLSNTPSKGRRIL